MEFTTTAIAGVWSSSRPTPHGDERGFFSRTFDADVAREAGIDPDAFVQDSMSRSARGVIRGLHVRVGRAARASWCAAPRPRSSTSSWTCGPDPPTYREWLSFDLDGDTPELDLHPAPGAPTASRRCTEPADTSYRIDRRTTRPRT